MAVNTLSQRVSITPSRACTIVKPLNTREEMELARRAGQRGAGIQKVEVLQWRISEKTIEQAIFVFRGEKLWYARVK